MVSGGRWLLLACFSTCKVDVVSIRLTGSRKGRTMLRTWSSAGKSRPLIPLFGHGYSHTKASFLAFGKWSRLLPRFVLTYCFKYTSFREIQSPVGQVWVSVYSESSPQRLLGHCQRFPAPSARQTPHSVAAPPVPARPPLQPLATPDLLSGFGLISSGCFQKIPEMTSYNLCLFVSASFHSTYVLGIQAYHSVDQDFFPFCG